MRTLKQVKCGETVSVVKLTGEGALKRRIMDMGITKGTEIYVRKVAPLGDPVEVTSGATSFPSGKAKRKTFRWRADFSVCPRYRKGAGKAPLVSLS